MSTRCAERPRHGVVVVTGPDATSFLESLVSQELTGVTPGEGVRSLLLTPQGKLDVDAPRAAHRRDEWSLDCDTGYGERLAASLRRYRIRVKAEIEDRSDGCDLLEVEDTRRCRVLRRRRTVEFPTGPVTWSGATGACGPTGSTDGRRGRARSGETVRATRRVRSAGSSRSCRVRTRRRGSRPASPASVSTSTSRRSPRRRSSSVTPSRSRRAASSARSSSAASTPAVT